MFLGVVQGHALGSMVFLIIGVAVIVLGAFIFKDDN